MKKFDRLPPEERRQEIQSAALALFLEKGFRGTTMENIVSRVSLSKGGVYRIYPSTQAILEDLILSGMRLRNAYYGDRVRDLLQAGKPLTLEALVEMIVDSLLLYPEISSVYVEFLWEKQRSPQLEALYDQIRAASIEETEALARTLGAESLLGEKTLDRLTDLMNAAILSLKVLRLEPAYQEDKDRICRSLVGILEHL